VPCAGDAVVGDLQRGASVNAIASAGVAPACCMCWRRPTSVPVRDVAVAEIDVVEQDAPRGRQRQAEDM